MTSLAPIRYLGYRWCNSGRLPSFCEVAGREVVGGFAAAGAEPGYGCCGCCDCCDCCDCCACCDWANAPDAAIGARVIEIKHKVAFIALPLICNERPPVPVRFSSVVQSPPEVLSIGPWRGSERDRESA